MNLNKSDNENLEFLINKAKEDETMELECIFKGEETITPTEFKRIIQTLRSLFDNITITETLDINVRGFRFSLEGNAAIKEYCINEKMTENLIPLLTILKKKQKDTLFINDYRCRCNLKTEVEYEKTNRNVRELLTDWKDIEKTFRYKKRYSFLTKDEEFQYDLTVVKTSLKKESREDSRRVKKKHVRENQKRFVIKPDEITMDFENWWNSLSEEKAVNMRGRTTYKPMPKKTVKSSKVFDSDVTFEIELEYIGNKKEKQMALKPTFNNFLRYAGYMLQILQNHPFLMPQSDVDKAYKHYKSIMKTTKFGGPQSITLEMEQIVEREYEEYGTTTSIRKNYNVTDKADGERNLLIVGKDGFVYMMNRRGKIKSFGMKMIGLDDTVIDGEFIIKDKQNKKMALFMAFDCYFHKGKDIRTHPFSGNDTSRLEYLKRIQNGIESKTNFKLINRQLKIKPQFYTKQFYNGNIQNLEKKAKRIQLIEKLKTEYNNEKDKDKKAALADKIKEKKEDTSIFDKCRMILNREHNYHIDGLIFTPIHLGVGENPLRKKNIPSGRWDKSFKWKPPEENSIDFQVSIITDDDGQKKIFHRRKDEQIKKMYCFQLLVGYKPDIHTKHNALRVLNEGLQYDEEYSNILFEPTKPFLKDNANKMYVEDDGFGNIRCENRDIIDNGMFIECKWVSDHWVPMRKRDNVRPNDFTTAINVWNSIHNPITAKMITGEEKLDEFKETIYYKNLGGKDDSLKALTDFHSFVKRTQLYGLTEKGNILLDISVGKGGDLNKWLGSGLSMCVGIDINFDNLNNSENGAANRILNEYATHDEFTEHNPLLDNILLICADSSINYKNGKGAYDELHKYYLDILYGNIEETKITSSRLRRFYNLANVNEIGFDLISCQFSVHYFFENKTKLENMLRNVSSSLKTNGYFFGTCLDGAEIYKHLKDGDIIGEEGQKIYYKISKKYENTNTFPDTDKSLGKAIDVYFESIGSTTTEYLVNFGYFENIAKTFGLQLLSSNTFKEDMDELNKSKQTWGKAKNLDKFKSLLEFSLYNRKFVFQKIT
jgi:hypothetical protein